MTYAISDIHGCYEEYIKLLEKINFSEDDTLYILGDICDRGEKPMEVYNDIMTRDMLFRCSATTNTLPISISATS